MRQISQRDVFDAIGKVEALKVEGHDEWNAAIKQALNVLFDAFTDRRSETPGAADPGLVMRGRDGHPVYGPDAFANQAPSI